jgi:peptidase M50-like protein
MRSEKWLQAFWVAGLCLGALVVLVVLSRLGVAYGHSVHRLWTAWVSWFLVGVVLGLVWHEAGHFLCAILGALPVRLMSVGIGPLLWSSHIGDVRFELRLLPFGGMVAAFPLLISRKYWMLAFTLGGVLGNFALVAVLALLALIGAVEERGNFTLHAVVAAQFFLIAGSLLPYWVKIDGVRVPSDGLGVLLLPLLETRGGLTEEGLVYRHMLASYVGPGNLQPAFSSAAPRIVYQVHLVDKYAGGATLQAYREALEQELTGDLSRGEELLVLDSLITTGLITGEPGFRARLDEWSLRSLQLGPEIETLRGSRGSVLVELGRWEEGKVMLAKLAPAAESFDLFMIQAYLARAERALGNSSEAERLLRAARASAASSPDSPAVKILLPRLEAEMDLQPQQQTT